MKTLKLKDGVKDLEGNMIKVLKYDFGELLIKDLCEVERFYFSMIGSEETSFFQESSKLYKVCAFFLSAKKFNENLSFIEFLKIKGKDRGKILKATDEFLFPDFIFNKKKELNSFLI